MNNFDESNQESIADFILEHLPRHPLLALGTVNSYGSPWVVCVNMYVDEEMNIYWKSQKGTEHSKNIARNPEVGLCVFSHTEEIGDFGLYASGEAHEVIDEQVLEKYVTLRYKEKGLDTPPISKFQSESVDRVYRATIKEAWVNDSRHTKQHIDIEVLRNRAKEKVSV